ncbi:MAG: hypothetical protein BKP49_06190 [Treponema sp. CETP13]|nr:MAG: hypothetical protein BKP49_06190 [Treponema sp. CETP13]
MIWVLLVIIGTVVFSLSAGNYIYKSRFKRSNYEKKSFVNNEAHVKDPIIMEPLLEKKQQWTLKKSVRNIECVKIKGFVKKSIQWHKVPILCGELWVTNSSFVVIIVHGFSDSSDGMGYLAEEYHKLNFIVLSINLRAHGQSSGEYPGLGYLDKKDLNLWIDYLREKFGENIKIIIHGISMGAGTVVQTLFSKKTWNEDGCKIIGAVADCGFSCFKDQISLQIQGSLGFSRIQKVIGNMIYLGCSFSCYFHAGFFIGKSFPTKVIENFNIELNDKNQNANRPFLIIFQGTKDKLVFPENADLLYLAAQKKAITKNTIVKVNNAPHIGSYFYDPKKYMDTITKELRKYN